MQPKKVFVQRYVFYCTVNLKNWILLE